MVGTQEAVVLACLLQQTARWRQTATLAAPQTITVNRSSLAQTGVNALASGLCGALAVSAAAGLTMLERVLRLNDVAAYFLGSISFLASGEEADLHTLGTLALAAVICGFTRLVTYNFAVGSALTNEGHVQATVGTLELSQVKVAVAVSVSRSEVLRFARQELRQR